MSSQRFHLPQCFTIMLLKTAMPVLDQLHLSLSITSRHLLMTLHAENTGSVLDYRSRQVHLVTKRSLCII